jgi:RNA polymerase sigma-70 factor (ECF subfamily)
VSPIGSGTTGFERAATVTHDGDEEFIRLTDPFRRELLAHCYRMLGSVHDAEDLVQETYLRAWRSFDGFEGRSSLRTWLYRIATSACLTALDHRSRRFLPSGLGAPTPTPGPDQNGARPTAEVAWLQPIPDTMVEPETTDPAAIVASRGSMRLALVAALQHLPARQRAVLILRDVLAWRAAETAEILDTTTVAVNSTLRRARAQIEQAAPVEDEITEPADPTHRALLDRYVNAFQNADVNALLQVLRDDVTWEMPPQAEWYVGRQAVGDFLATRVLGTPGMFHMIPTRANGQPALATYIRDHQGTWHADALQILTTTTTGISHIVAFLNPTLFTTFGLPLTNTTNQTLTTA